MAAGRGPGGEAKGDGRQELRAAFKRIEAKLPPRLASGMRWLRHPDARWVRIPVGVLLMLGGVFSILPFLGIWMLPLGLMLIAADVPFLRRPMARFANWCTDKAERFNARRKKN